MDTEDTVCCCIWSIEYAVFPIFIKQLQQECLETYRRMRIYKVVVASKNNAVQHVSIKANLYCF